VAINAQWVVTTPFSTTTSLYTVPANTSATYAYVRDLVVTNSGTATAFFSLGTGATSAATTSSFVVPTGGSVILTQCQVPGGAILWGATQGGVAGSASVGYALNVAYV